MTSSVSKTDLPLYENFEQDLLTVIQNHARPKSALQHIPTVFNGLQEYISKFYYSLLEEAGHDVTAAYQISMAEGLQFRGKILGTWTENNCNYLEISTEQEISLVEGTILILSEHKILHETRFTRGWCTLAAVVTQSHSLLNRFEARLVKCDRSRLYKNVKLLEFQFKTSSLELWIIPTCRLSSHLRCRDALSVLHSTSLGFQNFLLNPRRCETSVPRSDELLKDAGLNDTNFLTSLQEKLNAPQLHALLNCLPPIFHSTLSQNKSADATR
jgi:hypothetical protein